jgi:uncharacterized membrane protein
MIGTIHWITAALALVAGGAQLAAPKGTPGHRRLGWIYAGLLVVANATALVTYRDTGGWNQFHWLALVSLATLLVALGGFVVFGQRWWISHAYVSAGSWLGVVLAGLFQLATHVPMRTEALGASWVATALLAGWLFLWKVPRDVRHTGHAPTPRAVTACRSAP